MKTRQHRIEFLESRIVPATTYTTFGLAGIDGTNGFTITGGGEGGADIEFSSIANVGDVNGDGLNDLVVGFQFSGNVAGGNMDKGLTALIFGKAGGFPANINLDSLGANGVIINGQQNFDHLGASVAAAGDVNDDGIGDFIISAPGNDAGAAGSEVGAAYVIFGRTTWAATLALVSLNGTTGFKIVGDNARTGTNGIGEVVGGFNLVGTGKGGDFNGDGIDDVIVASSQYNLFSSSEGGAAFVIFGKNTTTGGAFTTPLTVSALNGTNGLAIGSSTVNDHFGLHAGFVGDVNQDGFTDLSISNHEESQANRRTFIVFGKGTGNPATIDVNSLTTAQGFELPEFTNESFIGPLEYGADVTLRDIDADGDLDLGVSITTFDFANIATYQGYAFVKNKGDGYDTNPFGSSKNEVRQVLFGLSNVGVDDQRVDLGDFNGDGRYDLVAFQSFLPAPVVPAVYYGTAPTGRYQIDNVKNSSGVYFSGFGTITGNGSFDPIPFFIGDVSGDGIDDIALRPPPGVFLGNAFIVFGSAINPSADGKTVVYRDVDGDTVTVKTNKGALTREMFTMSHPVGAVDRGQHLDMLDLTSGGQDFSGANITISVKKGKTGDGRASIGAIDATGIDLGTVKITGNLNTIDAGDADFLKPGLNKLDVYRFGRDAGGAAVASSDILGRIGSMTIRDEFDNATVNVTGAATEGLGSISITKNFLGAINLAGPLGSFKAVDVLGGSILNVDGTSTKKTTVTAHLIADGATIDLVTTIGKLSAKQIGTAAITAARIDTLSVTGDTKAALPGSLAATIHAVGGVGSVSVKENFSGNLDLTSGPLNSFKAFDLLGSATIKAFGLNTKKTSITAHVINDGVTIDIANTLSKLSAARIGDATITADRIDSLSVNGDSKLTILGDLSANITLDNDGVTDGKTKALGTVKIAGTFHDATISAAGSVGSFSAAAMQNAKLYAGYTPTTPATPLSGGVVLTDVLISSFTITGKATLTTATGSMDDSFVVAANLGTISLPTIDTTTGPATWGFGYRDSIKKLTAKVPAFTYNVATGGTQTSDDFSVVKLS